MATLIKITQLPEATGLTNDDFLLMVDNPDIQGISKKVRVEKIVDLIVEIDGGDIIP